MRSQSRRGGLSFTVVLLTLCLARAALADTPTFDASSSLVRFGPADATLPISVRSPSLSFEGLPVIPGAAPTSVHGDLAKDGALDIAYASIPVRDSESLDVKLRVEWSSSENLLRIRASLRWNSSKPSPFLKEVVLSDIDVSGRAARPVTGDTQSYPAFFDGFFAGIEFPVAATRLDGDHLLLAHRPGVVLAPGVWYESRNAVVGSAVKGQEMTAFQRYVAGHLPEPHGFHANYNSWWTSPVPYKESDILQLMATFREKLYTPHQTSFDTFCIDMGWSNAHSLWEIDPALFPAGFAELGKSAESMHCRLGLWISPSSCYPPALDNDWASQNGYETFLTPWVGGKPTRFACLGGAHYQQAFRARLVELATRYGVRHFKLDGYQFTCPESGHGHAPGALSAEAVADGLINAAEAVRKVAPDVWFEPTCFGLNPSPWWLFHFNSVIGSYGDDAPYGRVPAPVYRESYTTARDYFNLQGAYWSPVPIAAQEVLGIVHQTPEPFLNDAVMTVLRGHMFLPLYLNPAHMNDDRWKSFADLLKWARANENLLQDTEPILPASWRDGKCPKFTDAAVMPREPYGYAHWMNPSTQSAADHAPGPNKVHPLPTPDSKVGVVALRNPWVQAQSVSFVVGGARAKEMTPSTTKPLSVVSLHPEPRVYAKNVRAGDVVNVALAPYETVVLSVQTKDPPRGATKLPARIPAADAALKRTSRVSRQTAQLERVEFGGHSEKFGPDWTCPLADTASIVRYVVDATVQVDSPQAELLILHEGKTHHGDLACAVTIDDKPATIDVSDSSAGWAASGLLQPETWVFYRAKLHKGANRLHITASGAAPACGLSGWLWSTKPGTGAAPGWLDRLPSPEIVSLGSVPVFNSRDLTPNDFKEVSETRPVERIDGVYLDALTPASVTQGYGTLQRNQSVWEKPMTIAGKHFMRGLGTHAPSRIVYKLDGTYRRFQCWAGADSATNPTITFTVLVDGQKRWESGPVDRNTPPQRVDLDIAHAQSLELLVGDGGNGIGADHADWADAQLVR